MKLSTSWSRYNTRTLASGFVVKYEYRRYKNLCDLSLTSYSPTAIYAKSLPQSLSLTGTGLGNADRVYRRLAGSSNLYSPIVPSSTATNTVTLSITLSTGQWYLSVHTPSGTSNELLVTVK